MTSIDKIDIKKSRDSKVYLLSCKSVLKTRNENLAKFHINILGFLPYDIQQLESQFLA